MRAIHQHHDADATSTETRALSEAPSPWLALRVLLTVAAAVLLLIGSFFEWSGGTDGSEVAIQGFWSTDAGTAGFFSSDDAEIDTFLETIEAGVVYVNRAAGATTGAWPGVQPFGGWKGSGTGGKAGGGLYYVQQFLREQSRSVVS